MGYSPYSQHLLGHPGLDTELKDSQSHGDSVLPPPPQCHFVRNHTRTTSNIPWAPHFLLRSPSDRELSLMFLLHSQERQYHWIARPFHSLSAICKFSVVALYTKDSFWNDYVIINIKSQNTWAGDVDQWPSICPSSDLQYQEKFKK